MSNNDDDNEEDEEEEEEVLTRPMRLFSLKEKSGSIKRGLTSELAEELGYFYGNERSPSSSDGEARSPLPSMDDPDSVIRRGSRSSGGHGAKDDNVVDESGGGGGGGDELDDEYFEDEQYIDNEDLPLGIRLFYAVKHPERREAWLNFLFGDWDGDVHDMTNWRLVELHDPNHARFRADDDPSADHKAQRSGSNSSRGGDSDEDTLSALASLQQYAPDLAITVCSFMDIRTARLLSSVNKWWNGTVRLCIESKQLHPISPVVYVLSGLSQFHMAADHRSTPVHMAAAVGNTDALRALIYSGYVDLCLSRLDSSYQQLTPIHVASSCKARSAPDVLRLLVSHGKIVAPELKPHFDVNGVDMYGQVAVHRAIEWGRASTLEALIQLGADPERWMRDTEDGTEMSPLMFAVQRGHHKCAQVLLSAAVAVDDGTLWTAIDGGDEKMVDLLLDAKADPNQINGVKLYDNGEVVDRDCPVLALCFGELGIANSLLNAGVDVNRASSVTGFTALHAAAYESKQAWMADRRMHVGDGWSWDQSVSKTGSLEGDIGEAFEQVQLEYMDLLVTNGADVNAMDNEGRTAEQLYRRTRSMEGDESRVQVVNILSSPPETIHE